MDAWEKARAWVTVDTTGADQDTIVIKGEDGSAETVLISTKGFYKLADEGKVALPDGTVVTSDDIQLAFQEELIAKTGMCVLEHEYHRIGATVLEQLARSARGAGEPE